MRKDKEKVLDEQWDDERVASFLQPRPGDPDNSDYAILLRAYQSMREADFERFVPLFVAAGRDIHAPGPDGRPLIKLLAEHRYGAGYAQILETTSAA